MAEVTITIQAGAQTASITLPDATVERLRPMVEALYRPLAPDGASELRCFGEGIRSHLIADLRRFERRAAAWLPPDTTTAGENG